MNQNWALYNALKNWTLYNLTEHDVSLLLMTFSENELKLAKICKNGDSKWDTANGPESSAFLKAEYKIKYSMAEGYPTTELKGDSDTDTDIIKMKDARPQQPRLHNRKEVSVNCKIVNAAGKEFQSDTLDLSEGGICFNSVIPDWIAGYFIVLVDSKFQLMCSIVEDQKEKTRVQIVSDENDSQYLHYKDWLDSL